MSEAFLRDRVSTFLLLLNLQTYSMPLFELSHESLTSVPRTTFHEMAFKERNDLQRLLKTTISALGDDLLVLAEEFSQWMESRRRIDLLALDRKGSLVVIELKRTEDGGHMELQAIRYAAMISTLTFHQATEAHAEFLEVEVSEAEDAILQFLGLTEPPENFGKSVRIVLVSPDFSLELTTAILWLNSNGLDIRCVRIRPYNFEQRTLLEIEQIIPLREAQEYTVRLREKEEEARLTTESNADFTRYDLTANGRIFSNLWKRNLIWRVISEAVTAGLTLEVLTSIVPARKMVVVDGHPRGQDFFLAAQKTKAGTRYTFQPTRLFMDDEHLIDIGDHTVAISTQWGIRNLPMLEQIIREVPAAKISYKPTDTLQ